METFKEAYKKFLDLPSQPLPNDHPSVRALNRAHDLRKLELEFYWQRSSYSWTLQGAAFAALAFIFKDGMPAEPALLLPATAFGAITALASRLTAAGSKFWQENWEHHVELLEETVEGRLAQTVIVTDKVSFSVSKINERLLTTLVVGWLLAFLMVVAVVADPTLTALRAGEARALQIGIAVPALIGGLCMLSIDTVTGLKGREWSDGEEVETRVPGRRRAHGRPRRFDRPDGGSRRAGSWIIQRYRSD